MSKHKLIIIACMGLFASNAFGSKLISVTTYNTWQLTVKDGIHDDGFSSPDAICYDGVDLDKVCGLAQEAAAESKAAYPEDEPGYFEILSCVVLKSQGYVDLKYSQITDFDGTDGPHKVEFKVGHCN